MVEVSGIPFGLMGEMLQDGGNPWRGMVFGMTGRLPWAGNPGPMWKVWDQFGMEGSKMIGYWVESNPVKTNQDAVLATAFVREDETLVAVASWAPSEVQFRLDVDWEMLGLNPQNVVATAPAIEEFQTAGEFDPMGSIPVEPGKGWLLILKERSEQ